MWRVVKTFAWDATDPGSIPGQSINPELRMAAALVRAIWSAVPLVSSLYPSPTPFNSVLVGHFAFIVVS